MKREQLVALWPKCPTAMVDLYVNGFNEAFQKWSILDPVAIAVFLGQVSHECGEGVYVREVWGPTARQKMYERDFTKPWDGTSSNQLAWTLGNDAKGDGYTFRGWGNIQNTGKKNTLRISLAIYGDDRLVKNPKLLDDPALGPVASGFFWTTAAGLNLGHKARAMGVPVGCNLNDIAKKLLLQEVTCAVNGDCTMGEPSEHGKRMEYAFKALALGITA